jgi:hypothetical protein
MPERRSIAGEIPIEQAPLWVLAIAALLLALVSYPALVGILDGIGAWHGEKLRTAVAATVLGLVVIAGLATRKPWKRPRGTEAVDQRPWFVRFSSWLWGVVLYPNVLHGILVLARKGPPPDYRTSLFVGLLLSGTQGLLAWLDRRERAAKASQ